MLNELHNQIKNRIRALDRTTRIGLAFVAIATVFALAVDLARPAAEDSHHEGVADLQEMDTFIPNGFALVPIEVINSSGVDSILGRFGMADLFLENRNAAVMKNVRLVRGAQNDSWAALVPEQYAQTLLSSGGRFFISVRSRNAQKIEVVKKQALKKERMITYEN